MCQSVSHFLYHLSLAGSQGVLEPIPAVIGRAAGYTLDRSPVCHRAGLCVLERIVICVGEHDSE